MRRWIATVTTTAAVAVAAAATAPAMIAPAHAQAAPKGPVTAPEREQARALPKGAVAALKRRQERASAKRAVTALKRQFVAGRGVKVTETITSRQTGSGGAFTSRFRTTGAYMFGASGAVASDLTYAHDSGGSGIRVITTRNASYTSGGFFGGMLPEGKTWLRWPGPESFSSSVVNALEPTTLKGLLATTEKKRRGGKIDGVSTTLRTGSITVRQLYAASPSLRRLLGEKPQGATGDLVIDWRLWQDGKQRTRKLVSSYTESTQGLRGSWRTKVTATSLFRAWGTKITIKAPAAASVLDIEDWQPEEPLPVMPDLRPPLPGRDR
ncbi:hypothetical protein Ppa06_08760 [Planomonospora parontospora subsp. parontospora]|uniref:Lipoprotein n=2 Tax=Planomonospora parontospora TaxID=58119 RepID=A0AA37F2T1_9ACTN|nr:hypothetical protein [Planomonospora parontospora]GGK50795.1 hypothetical protein GCM10010126_07850 [Planomonospora parontospora]GII07078.1 hypothetical protein Ppa06_08760 [Planomonospora parontospora subsp. parontospora]